jgi:ribose 1,5-bisphosphokinase
MSKLFYIVGASGSGKDTLINYVRNAEGLSDKIIFAHRYITRPAFSGNENHISLSKKEFQSRLNSNLFALHWESHGNYYAIGVEINYWMEMGFDVVMNGSREYLLVAKKKYPEMIVISIETSQSIIANRLKSRGRESSDEIKNRVEHNGNIIVDLNDAIRVQNDGTIEEAGEILVRIISQVQA